jgi:hypothetical protein
VEMKTSAPSAAESAFKPRDSELAEPPPPQADGRLAHVQALGQLANTFAARATEHDPRPLGQPLCNGLRAQPRLQFRTLRFAHVHPACLYSHVV